jgi:hypothetical protein
MVCWHRIRRFRQAAPSGVDVFFDNVGGEILDEGLKTLRLGARVRTALCARAVNHSSSNIGGGVRVGGRACVRACLRACIESPRGYPCLPTARCASRLSPRA